MGTFSFVHCGDIHLGCQQFNESVRFDDFGRAFSQIVEYAIENKVNAVLIAGDLFHQRSINAQTLEQAISLLAKLRAAQIDVLAIEGNHDKAFYTDKQSWMEFLNSQRYIKLLKPAFIDGQIQLLPYDGDKGCIVTYDGVRIIGLGYLGATTRQRLEEIALILDTEDDFTIVLLHAAVDKLMGQDMAGVQRQVFDDYQGKVDYFALGHIHSRSECGDLLYNPGAPECVHIDEAKREKEKGFYHVLVEDGKKTIHHVPSHRRQVHYAEVDVTGTHLPAEVIPYINQTLERFQLEKADRPMVQIILYGTVDYNPLTVNLQSIREEILEQYGCLVVEVLNNINLPQLSGDHQTMEFDREMIERHVIGDLIVEHRPDVINLKDSMTDLIIRMKNDALAGISEDEMISVLENMVDQLPFEEAAVTKVEGDDA